MPKNWCFWAVVLGKTLESPLDWSNQSILKEISPEYSLEGLMLKLKLQYFGHLMRRTDSFGKTLILEKTEGKRRRGQQRTSWWMASPTQWIWVRATSRRWWRTGKPGVLQSMGSQRVKHDWVNELNCILFISHLWALYLFFLSYCSGHVSSNGNMNDESGHPVLFPILPLMQAKHSVFHH